jgi:site-specific DNA-methyltransferase (adenine-specific)
MERTLVLRDIAKQKLAEIKDIESGFSYLNKVKAIEVWAKAEKIDAELQNMIAEQKIRTQRILGKLLKESEVSKSRERNLKQNTELKGSEFGKSLSDYGITWNESSTFQQIASLPEEIFEKEIAIAKNETRKRIELTTARLLKAAKQYNKSIARKERTEEGKAKNIEVDFRLGDFVEVFSDIPDGSIDCIITDPPYKYEYIEQWSRLSRFAKRVLKPHGFCIAYSGQMHLPEVMKRMSEHLDYYWTFCVYHEGQTQIVNGVNLICRWKPVLIYQNGKKKLESTIQDYFISENREKDGHDWQQSRSGIAYLIDNFTSENDVIMDPFAGSGTTIMVASQKRRHCLAAEINEETFNLAKSFL